MCGIFMLLNHLNNTSSVYKEPNITTQFEKGKGRGPEYSVLCYSGTQTTFGFHRLAINGLNDGSNQPLIRNNITLICNGEIYNYRELYKMMGSVPETQSDCEVILHLYERYGIDQTMQMLDGVFAFALLDNRFNSQLDHTPLYVARDPYGVRPLFQLTDNVDKYTCILGFASELKMLSGFSSFTDTIAPFPPGHYAKYSLPHKVLPQWKLDRSVRYHTTGFTSNITWTNNNVFTGNIALITGNETTLDILDEFPTIYSNIRRHLTNAVFKRCLTTERPIACLLSGGLDSSLITALVSEYHKINDLPPIETYSIGLQGSEDLKNARIVADYLGTKHTEIILTEKDFINAVPSVIEAIESYDTTTVRASIGNWLIGKYIREHSQAKVIFNGDGADELCGGYLYMGKATDAIEFDRECRRLLSDIHYFDVLRSDRCISCHGLEPRTPFLDRSFVQQYLAISPELRFHTLRGQCEKYLLRTAFSYGWFENSKGRSLLPNDVLWRRKEAFSDGVSGSKDRSLFQVLQEHANSRLELENIPPTLFIHNTPQTPEQKWYRSIFENLYPKLSTVIPYFWMPKYVNATDASARTLAIYKN